MYVTKDMNQAEVVEVVNCDPCEPIIKYCICKVKGLLNFTHYGEIYKVNSLTRTQSLHIIKGCS